MQLTRSPEHIWYRVIPCGTVWYLVILCDTVWYLVILCDTLWYFVILCDTLWFIVILCDTLWCSLILSSHCEYLTAFIPSSCIFLCQSLPQSFGCSYSNTQARNRNDLLRDVRPNCDMWWDHKLYVVMTLSLNRAWYSWLRGRRRSHVTLTLSTLVLRSSPCFSRKRETAWSLWQHGRIYGFCASWSVLHHR